MSWLSKNYEKAALGGAAVLALGLAYMGWSRFGGVAEDFAATLTGGGNSNAAVAGADLIPKARASMTLDRIWDQAVVDGDRTVDLFTGIPLFVSSKAPETPVDLAGKNEPPVHPPIPNMWWIENRLDPGFGDSPSRDPDHDGFSNLEEFNAKTDPNNAKDVPSLIAKLMYVRDESLTWVIRPGFGGDGGSFPFTYEDNKKGMNKTGAANMITPGQTFFAAGIMQDRFKLLGSEVRKVMNKKTNSESDVTIVRIEDQRPNKKGTIYEFPAPLNDQLKNEYLKYDRTAVLSLEALGQGGKEFKVEENTTFGLPFDSPKKNYRVKSLTAASVTIEYPDAEGKTKTLEISKGSLPKMGE
ncbi:MAG: Amuc_1099 family pilus-like system protein [Luteolibacter sp.]|uniref:Amuc_1099 family pilus-like system protein n=1 Tax=Luteolibacter sp. TaxID=1962973 RepID=UPI003263D627